MKQTYLIPDTASVLIACKVVAIRAAHDCREKVSYTYWAEH